eukprot:7998979-Prorocentrum_lima.AAC.1
MGGGQPSPPQEATQPSGGDLLRFVSYNVTSLCCSHPLTSVRVQLLASAFAQHGVHVAAIQEGRWRTTGCTPAPPFFIYHAASHG